MATWWLPWKQIPPCFFRARPRPSCQVWRPSVCKRRRSSRTNTYTDTSGFIVRCNKIYEKFTANCKNPKNIKKLTRIFCMSTLGHKQESSVWTKFSNFHFSFNNHSGSLDKLCLGFFPNLCFVFALAHTILKNIGIKTDFQFYTALPCFAFLYWVTPCVLSDLTLFCLSVLSDPVCTQLPSLCTEWPHVYSVTFPLYWVTPCVLSYLPSVLSDPMCTQLPFLCTEWPHVYSVNLPCFAFLYWVTHPVCTHLIRRPFHVAMW